jgi:serine/threonine-protein kinase
VATTSLEIAAVALAPGQKLAHYRLVEKIGEGGMGVVWKARDTRLGRDVALKLLPEALESDPERLARILDEARIVAGLNHPNVVTIHAVEEFDDHRFLVMELVTGRTLREVVPDEGLPLDRFFRLAVAIADAVGAAHERGVVHNDLKPGNIMIGEGDRVTVLDFGLARSLVLPDAGGDSDTTTRTLTTGDGIEGTMPYMAPEQINGEAVDGRTDLFALGVIFYEMITGRAPFTGNSAAELIASILRDDPRPIAEHRRRLPRHLGRIIRHAMEKNRQRRFQTARDLRNELEQLAEELDHESAVPDVRAVAVLPLDDLSGDPEQGWFADGMTDALIDNLARIGALKVISRTSAMRYKGTTKTLSDIARELGVDAIVEGSVLRAGNRVRITARLIDADRDRPLLAESFEHDLDDVLALQSRAERAIAERIEVQLTPQEHEHLTRTERIDPEVHEACLRGRYLWHQRTTESVRGGLEQFEKAARIDPGYAPAYAGIADSYIVDGGRYLGVSPKVAYTRARSVALKATELDDSLAEAHTSLAAVMTDYDWDWEGADREYRRAIELNPNYVTAHSWYAEQLSRMGRHDEAIAEARRAWELDPLSLSSSMIVAWILYFARRYDAAIEQARHTLALDPKFATAHRILGWACEETGRHDEAVAAHERASELTGRQPNFAGQLGRAYALAGRRDDARRVLQELIEASKTTYVSSLDIAIVYTALGERTEALDWLERAHDEHADHLPYLGVNPRLDALRDEPRFVRLLEQMGLAPAGRVPE